MKIPRFPLFIVFIHFFLVESQADTVWDSLAVFRNDTLAEVQVAGYRDRVLKTVPEKLDMVLIASKKASLIDVKELDANLVQNSARQVFSRTPGVFVFESDGSGVQMGVSVRGLSPNRSWEFNVRQNGYDIAADPFGYPEAYYSPSLEAVEQVQLIRGAASLQFGPQFGGLLNYRMKKGNTGKRISVESMQSVGSYGLLNTYNSIGGQLSKWNYFISWHHRQADGWRKNAEYRTDQVYARLGFQPSKRFEISLEATALRNKLQQPGGLTDSLFAIDPSQSMRARNWFSTPWNTANLSVDWRYSDKLRFTVTATVLGAERNSIGMISAINVPDTINRMTGNYAARQLDRDYYTTFTTELRMNYDYQLFGRSHSLSSGMRYFNGNIDRLQNGPGTNGASMDFSLISAEDDYPRNLEYMSTNVAAFAENIFHISPSISITPGFRLESIRSSRAGRLGIVNSVPLQIEPETFSRSFVLTGIGADWKFNDQSKLYFNFAQSYRPVTYAEITPAATTDVVDPGLKDASGYNLDLGAKGRLGEWLSYDGSVFYINYNDRIGNISLQRDDLSTYQYRTNLGNSRHKGVELFVEVHPFRLNCPESFLCGLGIWISAAYTQAEYTDFSFTNTTGNEASFVDLSGKKVEYAPEKIIRYGLTWASDIFSATLQGSYTSSVYTDANNTTTPSANAQAGLLAAYTLYDFSVQCTIKSHYLLKLAINNLLNVEYATRRSGGYPGPGLLPGEGRTFVVTAGVRF